MGSPTLLAALCCAPPALSACKGSRTAPLALVEFSGQKKPAAHCPVGPTASSRSGFSGSTSAAPPLPAAQ